tara:strand:- start:2572 stop:3387 length:816 start_codon:yes stop_codon:yes gene_type:complete
MEERECRICFESDNQEDLISPCLCDGTSKWVHRQCLNEWRETNIDKPANTNCMECKYKYRFKYLFPEEKKLLKNSCIYKNKITYLIFLCFSLFPVSYLFFALDKQNDYLYIEMISYDKTIFNETKFIINNDSFYNTFIYNTLSLTVYTNVYMSSFFAYTLYKKQRKFLYFMHIYKKMIRIFITINNPFYIFYFFLIVRMHASYIVSQTLLSILCIFLTIDVIYKHNKLVDKINTKFNKKLILNYEHNFNAGESKIDDLLLSENNIMLQDMA